MEKKQNEKFNLVKKLTDDIEKSQYPLTDIVLFTSKEEIAKIYNFPLINITENYCELTDYYTNTKGIRGEIKPYNPPKTKDYE
jgi:hypothetical protein